MKPVELVERAIRNSSRPGDIVLDPFGGSGTTLIAAEKTGRIGWLRVCVGDDSIDALFPIKAKALIEVVVQRGSSTTNPNARCNGSSRCHLDLRKGKGVLELGFPRTVGPA